MDAINIHRDHFEILSDCTDEELGILMRSLMSDVLEEEEIELPEGLRMIRKYIRNGLSV